MNELSEKRVSVNITTKNKFVVFETGKHYFYAFEEDIAALKGSDKLPIRSTDRAAILLVNVRTLQDGICICYRPASAENSGYSLDSFTPKPRPKEQIRKKPDFGSTKTKRTLNQPRPEPLPIKPKKIVVPVKPERERDHPNLSSKCNWCNKGVMVRGWDGRLMCNVCMHSES